MTVHLSANDSINLTTGVVTRAPITTAPNLTPNGHATIAQRLRTESVRRVTRQNDLRALAHIMRTDTA